MQLKGFTLLEVLIALVLFGMITAFGSSAYLFVSKQFLDYKKSDEIIKTCMTIEALLNKDFSESYSVKSTTDGLTCFYNEKNPVQYKLNELFIIRIQEGQQDTFKIPALDIKMTLNTKPLNSDLLLNQLSFNTKVFEKDLQLNYTKLYGADLLMELETISGTGDTY